MSVHGPPVLNPFQKASILVFCAHRWEAEPFLKELELTPQRLPTLPFDLYGQDDVFLLVTGSGSMKAATATAATLAHLPGERSKVLLANFGIAGAEPESYDLGTGLLIHRVLQESSARAFYPERSLRFPWAEAPLITVERPALRRQERTAPPLSPSLYDMEGFGVCAGAESFLSNSQVLLGKVVSDFVDAEELPDWKELAASLGPVYHSRALEFLGFLFQQRRFLQEEPRSGKAQEADRWVKHYLELSCDALQLTVNQSRQLTASLRAFALAHGPEQREEALKEASECLRNYKTPNKKSRAKALQQLRSSLQIF